MNVVYTAIFGNYDDLKEPRVVTPGWRYICFTDQPLKSETWEIVHRPMMPEGYQRTARYYKIMFHRHIEAEYCLWVDGSFLINCDLNEWWNRFKDPVTCIMHPLRSCVYKEAEACIARRKDAAWLIRKQVRNYRLTGLPAANGMIASGIIMRKMCQASIDLCDLWYQQIQLYSVRDQIGFAFASWRHPVHHVLNWDYTKEVEFVHIAHLNKRKKIIL